MEIEGGIVLYSTFFGSLSLLIGLASLLGYKEFKNWGFILISIVFIVKGILMVSSIFLTGEIVVV